MDDYDDLNYCVHGVRYDHHCEKCVRAEIAYEKSKEQADFDYWHPVGDE